MTLLFYRHSLCHRASLAQQSADFCLKLRKYVGIRHIQYHIGHVIFYVAGDEIQA